MNKTKITEIRLAASYEVADDYTDGAQLVDGQWWIPAHGPDSLQHLIEDFCAELALLGSATSGPALTEKLVRVPKPIPLRYGPPGPADEDDIGCCYYGCPDHERGIISWGLCAEPDVFDEFWLPHNVPILPTRL